MTPALRAALALSRRFLARRAAGKGPGARVLLLVLLPGALGPALIGLLVIVAVIGIVGALASSSGAAGGCGGAAPVALNGPPQNLIPIYQEASAANRLNPRGPAVLAAINRVETGFGQNMGSSSAGAIGWMQFMPATWAQYGAGGDPYNPHDAIFAAARYLHANGAPGDWYGAIFAYNHAGWYVSEVEDFARQYSAGTGGAGGPGGVQLTAATPACGSGALAAGGSGAARQALQFALDQQGVPYVWGGESRSGYDCSGLVMAAYRSAGISLPRTAQEQFDAGPHLNPGEPAQPGDLVFFGGSTTDVEHVGMVVHEGVMVDAPHTGAVVRVEPYPTHIGDPFGSEPYVGATRPGAGQSGAA